MHLVMLYKSSEKKRMAGVWTQRWLAFGAVRCWLFDSASWSCHCRHSRLSCVHWRLNCFADRTTTPTSGNSSIDTSLRDIYCGPEVLFETCVTMKFVDDDDVVTALHTWNSLPSDVRSCHTVDTFKTYLFRQS